MTIGHLGGEMLRVENYNSNNFFDIQTMHRECDHMSSLKIDNMSGFGYWAVIEQQGNTCSPFAVVFFPDKDWFDEWRVNCKATVVFEHGRKKMDR